MTLQTEALRAQGGATPPGDEPLTDRPDADDAGGDDRGHDNAEASPSETMSPTERVERAKDA